MVEQQEFWFAARTRKDQELVVRDVLKKLGIGYFLPTQFVVRQLKSRKKKIEVPVIRNLIFIRATKEKACSIPTDYGIRLFYIKDLFTHSLLVAPERQMRAFMFVMDTDPDSVSFDNEPLETGERVQVVKGEFAGIEGELASVANRSCVIIRIPQVLSISVRIPESYIEPQRNTAF